MSDVEEFNRLNTRKASILHVGGFRPTGDPFASNFGLRPLGLPGEAWPEHNDKPLLFVCQMNLTMAPTVPAMLADIRLLTFFVKPKHGGLKKENGADWLLRAYRSLEGLVPLAATGSAPALKRGFECRWEECEDHPNYDDPDLVVPDGLEYPDAGLDNAARTKIGGYPSTIQSEPWWGYAEHPSNPAYCFQVNSEEKAGLFWGDGGTVYLARGTAAGCEDKWFLDWQCF